VRPFRITGAMYGEPPNWVKLNAVRRSQGTCDELRGVDRIPPLVGAKRVQLMSAGVKHPSVATQAFAQAGRQRQ
jgi:hypothetical protein